jgi:outer membrane protein
MNARRLWILAVILLGAFSLCARAQTVQRLTLKEAEQTALQNHPQIRAAQFVAAAANEVTTEARSAYYPYTFGSLTGAVAEHDSRTAAGALNNPIIFNRYANGITAGQLLTDFGRTQNLVRTSSLHAQAEQQGVTATRADVLLQVDQVYFGALRAQAVLKVAQETVKARQLVVDQVTALAQSKLKSGLDVSFANVNLAEAKLLLVQAQNDVESSFEELSAALGYADERRFELEEEPLPPAPPTDLSQLVNEAFRERPDLAQLGLDANAAHSFAKAERDLWFPSVSFVGTAGLIPYKQ